MPTVMLLKITTAAILLAVCFQLVEGFERVIVVTESDGHYGLSSDDENILVARAVSNNNDLKIFAVFMEIVLVYRCTVHWLILLVMF